MQYYLGIDCGGTFLKAGLFDEKGQLCALAREAVAVESPQAGRAERDLDKLWEHCANVIQQVLKIAQEQPHFSANQIAAISISAQGKGAFLLDKQGKPLGKGILSSDQRALDIVKEWEKADLPRKLYPLTRQTLWTGHPVAILRWLKIHEPERYQKIGAVLMSHDYLRYRLSGKLYCEKTNISESNLYNFQTNQYDPQLAEWLGIPEIMDCLPPIIGAEEIAGKITAQAAEQTGLAEGTPVVGGLFDVVSTALCAGLEDEHSLNVVMGTWSIVTGVTQNLALSADYPFVFGAYPESGKWMIHDDSPTSSGNLEWFMRQWQLNYKQVNQLVASLPPAQSSVLFVPFLYGSNAGLGMQAGFYGLQSYHQIAHLCQAVFEGVLFSLMTHLKRMLTRFPQVNRLRVTGGITHSPIWLQMLADLTGLTLEVSDLEETGCFGAALIAMPPDKRAALLQMERRQIIPNPEHFAAYQAKYQRYQRLIEGLKLVNG